MPRKTQSSPAPPAVAYSYLRFSSPEQAKGDSLRRQTELPEGWLARHPHVRLDTALTLRDEGVSAFTGAHRENPDRNALAMFLTLVKRGRIPRGSYLLIENLDRLSREDIRPALTLLLNLIDAGVRVVQLSPVEAVYDEHVEPMALMMAIMELSRGHSESRMKSERVGKAWGEKKRKAAEDKAPITSRVPAWLRVRGGQFEVIEKHAAVVRRVYQLATDGHGIGVITKRLNAEGVTPVGGRAGHWARSYVTKLLMNRAVVGEYQPHVRRGGIRRKPDGPPIPNYFPAILTEDQWHAARAGVAARRKKPGRIGKRVNLFNGLVRDARDGGTLTLMDKGPKSGGPALVTYNARQGVPGSVYSAFPLAVFEQAVLSRLREIDPAEVLPDRGPDADQVLAAAGRLAAVEGRITRIRAALRTSDDIEAVVEELRALDAERRAAADDLARRREEAASPLARAWGECRSLAEALDAAPDGDDARTRLRAALRRVVEGILCLFVRKKMVQLAAVQVRFAGGAARDYLIFHRPAHGNAAAKRPAEWWVRSFAGPGGAGLDLRDRTHVADLEKVLAGIDPATLG